MPTLYDLPAPAKINLFLHVVGRRADGYHLLQSVFVLLDLHDRIHLEARNDGVVAREDLAGSGMGGCLPANDLCVRAARALQKMTGVETGVNIGLEKRIPAEAGLGGGSSDAATVLLGLNRLWGTRLNRMELMALGQELGADVPFFLYGRSAWVEGTGDRMYPWPIEAQRYGVVKPPVGLSTAQVFTHPKLPRNTPVVDRVEAAATWPKVGLFGHNDLEAVARVLCPEVEQGLQALANEGLEGRMTGSGTALFARLMAGQRLPKFGSGWFAVEANSLVAHPLAEWV